MRPRTDAGRDGVPGLPYAGVQRPAQCVGARRQSPRNQRRIRPGAGDIAARPAPAAPRFQTGRVGSRPDARPRNCPSQTRPSMRPSPATPGRAAWGRWRPSQSCSPKARPCLLAIFKFKFLFSFLWFIVLYAGFSAGATAWVSRCPCRSTRWAITSISSAAACPRKCRSSCPAWSLRQVGRARAFRGAIAPRSALRGRWPDGSPRPCVTGSMRALTCRSGRLSRIPGRY